jgi:hypothetical protein
LLPDSRICPQKGQGERFDSFTIRRQKRVQSVAQG